MADDSPLLIRNDQGVTTLTLNRPKAGNAIDLEMARALLQAAIDCDEDPDVRCVVLTGAGRLFCAGGDIGAFAGAGDKLPSLLKALTAYLHTAISRLARMNKPLVTAVNGPAAGAGFSLAILGDLALAARSASFTLAYSGIGFSPDGGSTWLLPRLVGLRRAQELALTNRRLEAPEAAEIGLITRCVDDERFAAEVEALAQGLSRGPTGAFGRTRQLLHSSFESAFEAQMEKETQAIAASAATPHGREGVAAFLAKRRPEFR